MLLVKLLMTICILYVSFIVLTINFSTSIELKIKLVSWTKEIKLKREVMLSSNSKEVVRITSTGLKTPLQKVVL